MDKERILTTEAQAKAVQEVGFLSQFFQPTSPSEAAQKLGKPANLVHHHVQRHLELGLLQEVGRKNGKVLYQLTAEHFKVHRGVLPPGNPDNKVARELATIENHFLAAYERSNRLNSDSDPDYDHYVFSREVDVECETKAYTESPEPRPAHYQARTITLTPSGYRTLVQKITRLLTDCESEQQQSSRPCTFVFLGMDGELQPGAADSHDISSFVPPLKESV